MVRVRTSKKTNRAKTSHALSVPKWLECTWRRIPCGSKSCPVCSVLAQEQEKMVVSGRIEEAIIDALDDLRYSIAESFLAIIDGAHEIHRGHARSRIAVKRHAPRRFALYKTCDLWHEALHEVCDDAEVSESMWIQSTDAADLDWYVHVLLDYIHRHAEYVALHRHGAAAQSTAVQYTREVISQTAQVLYEALSRLSLLNSSEKGALMVLMGRFEKLRKDIALL